MDEGDRDTEVTSNIILDVILFYTTYKPQQDEDKSPLLSPFHQSKEKVCLCTRHIILNAFM